MNSRTRNKRTSSVGPMTAVFLPAIAMGLLFTSASAQQTNTYDVTFVTSGQHKWLPPDVAASVGPKRLFGGSFDAGISDVSLPSLSQAVGPIIEPLRSVFDIVGSCFYFVDIGACASCVGNCGEAAASCVGDCGGAAGECAGNCLGVLLCGSCPFSCIGSIPYDDCVGNCCNNFVNNCRNSCNQVKSACETGCNDVAATCENSCADCQPLQVCLADVIGAEITSATVSAGHEMFFDYGPLTSTTNNNVSVSYPSRVRITTPEPDTFYPGDSIRIETNWNPRAGASMSTTSPTDPIRLTNSMFFNADIEFDMCGPTDGDCTTQDNTTLQNIDTLFSSLNFDIPEAELFTITSAGESLCDLDPSALLYWLGLSGEIGLPNIITSASTSSHGTYCMDTGNVTDRFVDLRLDIDSWIAAYLCPPCKINPTLIRGFSFGFGPVSLGAFTIGAQLWDWDLLMRFDETQRFRFCGDAVDMVIDFGTPVDFKVRNSANAVLATGTDSVLAIEAGQNVEIVVPEQELSVIPEFDLHNTYSPSGQVEFLMTMDMQFLSLTLTIPRFKILCNPFDTSECVYFPHTDLGTLGPVLRLRTEDDPTDHPVFDIAIGNIVVEPLGIYDEVAPFELGGFNHPIGSAFAIDPQFIPIARISTPATVIQEGLHVFNGSESFDGDNDIVSYVWDFGDGSAEADNAIAIHEYEDDGVYVVTLTTTDANGNYATDMRTIIVGNAAPAGEFMASGPLEAGRSFSISLMNPTDSPADMAAGIEIAFDCGNGAGYSRFSTSHQASCIAGLVGRQQVGVIIRDKDGAAAEYRKALVVQEPNPRVVRGR